MARYIRFSYEGNGYVGTDSEAFFAYPDDVSDKTLESDWSDWAWQEHDQWAGDSRFPTDDDFEDEGPDGRWCDATDEEIETEQFDDLR